MREKDFVRFRCSGYPDCKQYLKIKIEAMNNTLIFRA